MITVGKSKIEAGTGRQIPMTNPAYQTLSFWAANFPNRNPNHFILPAEKYAAEGDEFTPKAYKTDPTNPIHTFKEAWEAAKERAGVGCRFHDLRATAVKRMRDAGVSFPAIGSIMGWSVATTVLMTKRYGGDVGPEIERQAVAQMENHSKKLLEGAQKGAQQREGENAEIQ
jgi:integrase